MKQLKHQPISTITQREINTLSISGRVCALRHYRDDDKLIFILKARSGNYYVEYCQPGGVSLENGKHVMVYGTLFTVREERGDRARIRAQVVHLL